jgi:hypothetical protein
LIQEHINDNEKLKHELKKQEHELNTTGKEKIYIPAMEN